MDKENKIKWRKWKNMKRDEIFVKGRNWQGTGARLVPHALGVWSKS